MAKKDIEIQPGFETGSSEFRSDDLTHELLELWHWSRGLMAFIGTEDAIYLKCHLKCPASESTGA